MFPHRSLNYKLRFAFSSFFSSSLIVLPIMGLFGWYNMVVRLGMPFSPEVLAGPMMAGVFISLFVSIINTVNYVRIAATEHKKINELNETQIEVIYTLSEVAESRCGETGQHIRRVAEYTELLGMLAKLPDDQVYTMKHASPLHDIGKIAVADMILLKPGRFTEEEYEIMKEHAEIGYKILSGSSKPIIKTGATIARTHHEKWDGTGYPNKLIGEEIPICGRIVAIADVFDALSCDRVYKKAWPSEQIKTFFSEQAGQHFDPNLTRLFLDHFDEFEKIRQKLK